MTSEPTTPVPPLHFIESSGDGTWTRFAFGALTCTVVTDGPLYLGPARETFPGASPDNVDELLNRRRLPTDHVTLDQNLLIVETGGQVVLVDTGVGTMPDLGRRVYGPQAGKAVESMRAAGFEPQDIDIVLLTHAHPDHCWGLLDSSGEALFTNARVLLGAADYHHFTDPAQAELVSNPHVRNQYTGARINLLPYGSRVQLIDHGHQVAEGITAVATPGHSPGHLIYEISSAGQTLVAWGDLCHHPILLDRPDWSFLFDGDRTEAARQRRYIFDQLVAKQHTVLSYHFPFPGLGTLTSQGDAYNWHPVNL
ncbi:MBL fold metallo-hydrolase [Streptomyces sp. NPDC007148]|uniref:MBL fold metallo-hydrolase n=1 Tax=unclassified Streptomyces TaxID=2593676 RepID=UPI003428580A